MKYFLLFSLVFTANYANANCDLSGPNIKKMVEKELQLKSKIDFKKAYWLRIFKSDTYAVTSVQYGATSSKSGEEVVVTHMVSTSCVTDSTVHIDSVISWSVQKNHLPSLGEI